MRGVTLNPPHDQVKQMDNYTAEHRKTYEKYWNWKRVYLSFFSFSKKKQVISPAG